MNHVNAALLIALAISGATSNDLQVGTDNGRIVFNETIQASPAIWRQVQKITVNVTDHEQISYVKVTDNRAEKDGEAQIVEGGEGQKNVTLELKSPTVFRGFDFHVVVFATQEKENGQLPVHPAVMTSDVDVNSSAKPEDQDSVVDSVTADIETDQKAFPETPENVNQMDNIPVAPVLPVEQARINRNTQETTSDPIVQYVTENNDKEKNIDIPIEPKSDTPLDKEDDTMYKSTEESTTEIDEDKSLTTEAADMMSTPEKTHESMVMQNYDGISKELGQKVIFGIKNNY